MKIRRLEAAAASDPGREREVNEDRVLADPERGIFAVIDGVGGESAGEVAAQLALETLSARLSRRTTDPERLIREAIAQANKRIYERAGADPRLDGMACVLTVAVLDGTEATVGHVGDSRLYVLKKGSIRKVTRDHSPVGAREDAGEISEAEAMSHPRRNEIFRDVGSAPHEPDEEGFIEVYRVPVEPDSALLLCSDGLSDLVPSEEIRAEVEAHAGDPRRAVATLIERANRAGGKDNISVVVVEGERFAASVRPGSAPAAAGGTRPVRGAGYARSSGGGRGLRTALLALLALSIVAALALLAFHDPARRFAAGLGLPLRVDEAGSAEPLRVGTAPGEHRSIQQALAAARPGDTVEVAPGTYPEPVELRDGVALVSRVPRGAVLRLPNPGSAPPDPPIPAVRAQGVQGARLSGFRIEGGEGAPLEIGIRLEDSAVEIEGVEVTGATGAALEIAGSDRSTVRYSAFHDNPGSGIVVSGKATPRLLHNRVSGNGLPAGGTGRPGVEIREEARPELVENRIEGNGAPQVAVAEPALSDGSYPDEIFRWNSFGQLPRERAVGRLPAPPEPSPSPAGPAAGSTAGRS